MMERKSQRDSLSVRKAGAVAGKAPPGPGLFWPAASCVRTVRGPPGGMRAGADKPLGSVPPASGWPGKSATAMPSPNVPACCSLCRANALAGEPGMDGGLEAPARPRVARLVLAGWPNYRARGVIGACKKVHTAGCPSA